MAKGRGKGRISNELVAASCAAVLAVYAAGYWRTREEARRVESRAQERRPVRTAGLPATAPAAIPAPAAIRAPAPEVPDVTVPARTAPTVAAKTPLAAPAQQAQPAPPPTAPAKTSSAPLIASTSEASAPAITATAEPAFAPTQAPASASVPTLPPPPVSEAPPVPSGKWRDGTYTGWGTSRHGDIKAQVVIRDGRIVEAGIASCETRYPCDVIDKIIPQPVARQSADVDAVSRATESADAYYFGLVEALKDAEAPPTSHAPSSP